MNIFVRIQDGIIIETIKAPFTPEFHPSLTWINVTNTVPPPAEGWSYSPSTGVFSPPICPDTAIAVDTEAG